MRLMVFAALAASIATAAAAGPFGIEMGTPVGKLVVIKREGGTSVYQITVPSPNSEFEGYSVIATPTQGVCKILAIGKDHDGDAYGTALRSSYTQMKEFLNQKYGVSKDFDYLNSGSIWHDSGEYAMSLRQNERHLATFWDHTEKSTMPSDISAIALEGKASSRSTTYLILSYEFKNFDECKKELDARNNAGL